MSKVFLRTAGKSKSQSWIGIYESSGIQTSFFPSPKRKSSDFLSLSIIRNLGSQDGPYLSAVSKQKTSVYFGTDSNFQLSVSGFTNGQGKGSSRWNLNRLKVPIVKKSFQFQAVYPGTCCDPGEFQFVHPNGYMTLTNLTGATGIFEDTYNGGGYDIGIAIIEPERFVLTNIISKPMDIE